MQCGSLLLPFQVWEILALLLVAHTTTLVYTADTDLPTYGRLIHNLGESLLVDGVLATKLDCGVDRYVDDNLAQAYVHFSHFGGIY